MNKLPPTRTVQIVAHPLVRDSAVVGQKIKLAEPKKLPSADAGHKLRLHTPHKLQRRGFQPAGNLKTLAITIYGHLKTIVSIVSKISISSIHR